jgi:hypothetical protein
MKRPGNTVKCSLALTFAMGFLAGCSTPIQERKVTESGFLRNYSELKFGEGGAARLIYINPKADFPKYDKILMDPISIWAIEGSELTKISEQERQELVNYLDAVLREQLKGDYEFVTRPGQDVMRLRVAITEGKKANVVLNTLSSVMPLSLAINLIRFAATGTHMAVGEAMVEAELMDSLSSTRLLAAVDARSGRKSLISGNFTKWGDVEDAYDYWSNRLRWRLSELRAEK